MNISSKIFSGASRRNINVKTIPECHTSLCLRAESHISFGDGNFNTSFRGGNLNLSFRGGNLNMFFRGGNQNVYLNMETIRTFDDILQCEPMAKFFDIYIPARSTGKMCFAMYFPALRAGKN